MRTPNKHNYVFKDEVVEHFVEYYYSHDCPYSQKKSDCAIDDIPDTIQFPPVFIKNQFNVSHDILWCGFKMWNEASKRFYLDKNFRFDDFGKVDFYPSDDHVFGLILYMYDCYISHTFVERDAHGGRGGECNIFGHVLAALKNITKYIRSNYKNYPYYVTVYKHQYHIFDVLPFEWKILKILYSNNLVFSDYPEEYLTHCLDYDKLDMAFYNIINNYNKMHKYEELNDDIVAINDNSFEYLYLLATYEYYLNRKMCEQFFKYCCDKSGDMIMNNYEFKKVKYIFRYNNEEVSFLGYKLALLCNLVKVHFKQESANEYVFITEIMLQQPTINIYDMSIAFERVIHNYSNHSLQYPYSIMNKLKDKISILPVTSDIFTTSDLLLSGLFRDLINIRKYNFNKYYGNLQKLKHLDFDFNVIKNTLNKYNKYELITTDIAYLRNLVFLDIMHDHYVNNKNTCDYVKFYDNLSPYPENVKCILDNQHQKMLDSTHDKYLYQNENLDDFGKYMTTPINKKYTLENNGWIVEISMWTKLVDDGEIFDDYTCANIDNYKIAGVYYEFRIVQEGEYTLMIFVNNNIEHILYKNKIFYDMPNLDKLYVFVEEFNEYDSFNFNTINKKCEVGGTSLDIACFVY